ncbi:TRAP transporter small permease [Vibrio sp. SCSIO 43140]|uniref:TRAP transporter small permease n=1 Tax=Vibrio sp. SCSIO 43140 TaxID=2819100 RepID=UPI0020750C04|nr:TRAP transporter small permease [Vibrio sp. SCSIO 43140]USD62640.1 TRAP transporter small permease [Vibrio sp. SCSIO 43140]
MYKYIHMIKQWMDKFVLCFCGFAIISLVLAVTWQVFSRYVLNDPSSWTDEAARYLMIWFGLAGASYLFGKNGHLAITLFVGALKSTHQKYAFLAINATSVAFISVAMIKGGLQLIGRTGSQLSPALQIPMSYVYTILPVAGVLMTLYIVLNTLELFTKPEHSRG